MVIVKRALDVLGFKLEEADDILNILNKSCYNVVIKQAKVHIVYCSLCLISNRLPSKA